MIVSDGDRGGPTQKVGGSICLEFTNTLDDFNRPDQDDELQTFADLIAWAQGATLISDREAAEYALLAEDNPAAADAALRKAKDLRNALCSIFSSISAARSPSSTELEQVNAIIAEVRSHMVLNEQEARFSWRWVSLGDTLEELVWPVAISTAELLASSDVSRISECGSDGCTWLFIDSSKNHSRRWCEMETCGNRAKARRHYARAHGKD